MVRTRGVLRGHPGNFPLERGQGELESCSKSSLALFSVFHLGPVPLKMGAPCKPRGPCPCLPIAYLSMGLDTWGTQGWNKVKTHNNSRDDDHSSSSVAFYSLSPSSCWILVVALGGGQDRDDLKDEK